MAFTRGKRNSQKDLVKEEKKEIRKQMIRRLGEQTPCQRNERSSIITERVFSSKEFKDAKTVMVYVSLPQEVNTEGIIQEALEQGKRVGVPYINPEGEKMIAAEIKTNYRLERGPLGILQPRDSQVEAIPLEEIDLVIVPALAYDRNNRRLGRGKAFYDNFLSRKGTSSPRTIGIAFDLQLVDRLPQAPHDRAVDKVITERN